MTSTVGLLSRRGANAPERRGRCQAALLAAALSMSTSALAQSGSTEGHRQRLFNSAFGGDKSRDTETSALHTLTVPLFVDNLAAAPVQARVAPDGASLQIEPAGLFAALAPLIEPGLLARLTARAKARGYVSLEDLRGEGAAARFDMQNLVLFIDLQTQMRRLRDIRIGPGPPVIGNGGIAPTADISSYMNVFGSLDYLHSKPASGLQANLAFEGALNVRGWVFESSLLYSDSARRPFQRGDLRLVRDDPGQAVRYSAGDLNYAVAGFQSFVPMAGFSVARNFTLQPYLVTQPTGSEEFILNQESQVEVLVNGIQNRLLTLPAGRYNFNDFQFTEGFNDVVLRATDKVGRVTTVASPFFFSSSLLAAGVEEFSYSLGQPSSTGPNGYTYSGPLSVSGFHHVGISDALTIGGNFQGSSAQQQLGGEFTSASSFGTVHMDFSASHQERGGFGSAARLSYNLTDFGTQNSGSSLLAQATYVGADFSTLGTTVPHNQTALDLGIRYTQRILTDVYASAGAAYQVNRNGDKNGHNITISLQRAFARGLIGNVRVYQSVDRGGIASFGALFAISWQLGDAHSFVQSSYDTASDTAQASYQYSPSNFVGEPGGALNVVSRAGEQQLTGSVFYNANRFETSLSQDVIFPLSGSGQGIGERTSLRASTSLVYADGHFGMGRPVSDSFAIAVPTENYADQQIVLDSSGTAGRYEARTDPLGPAVLPNLSAYQNRSISVTVPDLPLGYELNQDRVELLPSYRSGTVVVVGNDATVVLDGTLVDQAGAPLALMAGEIAALDRKETGPAEFFTNRQGRFRIEGLAPGKFELRLPQYPGVKTGVAIPAKTKGVYAVGAIKFPVEGGS